MIILKHGACHFLSEILSGAAGCILHSPTRRKFGPLGQPLRSARYVVLCVNSISYSASYTGRKVLVFPLYRDLAFSRSKKLVARLDHHAFHQRHSFDNHFTALSSAEHNEQLAVADLSFFSNTPPSVQVSDGLTTLPLRGDEAMEQDLQALGERDITFGWYSHYYNQDHLRQWIFGNGTMSFNISMSTCINSSDVAGVYQFMKGSTSTNATVGDIYMDLGYGTALANREKMMAQTLIDAQAAYDEISTFLPDSILCSGNSPWSNELRRQLFARPDGFQSNGRIMTVALQATGAVITFFTVNGIGLFFNDYPAIKYLFAGKILGISGRASHREVYDIV